MHTQLLSDFLCKSETIKRSLMCESYDLSAQTHIENVNKLSLVLAFSLNVKLGFAHLTQGFCRILHLSLRTASYALNV